MYDEFNHAVADALAITDVQAKLAAARAALVAAREEVTRLEIIERQQAYVSGERDGVFYAITQRHDDGSASVLPVSYGNDRRTAKTYRHVRTGLFHVELRSRHILTYEVAPHPNAEAGLTSEEALDAAISWVTRGERPTPAALSLTISKD